MPQNSTRSLLLDLATLITGLVLLFAGVGLVLVQATPAQATEAVCTTDLDCAAYELQAALYTGATVYEDLSFAPGTVTYEDGSTRTGQPMSALYSAKNDVLADAFWAAHAGEDWQDIAGYELADWLVEYRSA